MPPRISLATAKHIVYRPKPVVPQKRLAPVVQCRMTSDDTKNSALKGDPGNTPAGGNESRLPHVTEEQAAMDKIMGEEPPEIEEQGTPVQEILQRDQEAQDKAPEVLKKGFKNQKPGSGQSRAYSTSARRLAEVQLQAPQQLIQFEDTRAIGLEYPDAGFGHKFPLPDLANFKRTDHLRRRYDGIVDQVTKSLMRHGKLSQAQSNMAAILDTLRIASPPQMNIQLQGRKLLTDDPIDTPKLFQPAVPREALPFSPIQYLTTAIDSVAPLVKIRQQRGISGGGTSLPIPVPLKVKQRRRTAIKWILDSASSRKEIHLADRVAREIINVAEGKSGVWEKRAIVHKTAISARSNIRLIMNRRLRR